MLKNNVSLWLVRRRRRRRRLNDQLTKGFWRIWVQHVPVAVESHVTGLQGHGSYKNFGKIKTRVDQDTCDHELRPSHHTVYISLRI